MGPEIQEIWDYLIPGLIRHPGYTPGDLMLLGQLCRMSAALGSLWQKCEGKEAQFSVKGTPIVNPNAKMYLEYLTQVKQLSSQLGMSLKSHMQLVRGGLSIRLLEDKLKGAGEDALADFDMATAGGTDDGEW